jgi:adenosine deaminase
LRLFTACALALAIAAHAVTGTPPAHADEVAAAAAFAAVKDNAAQLRVFLQVMPKGGDLHNHLSGTPYAEDYLQAAAAKGLCVDAAGTALAPAPCSAERTVAALAVHDPFAFARLVDGLSTRGFQQGVGFGTTSSHDQFFASFRRFDPAFAVDVARWLAVARRNAARDHAIYLELMHDPKALVDYTMAANEEPLLTDQIADTYKREAPLLEAVIEQSMAEVDGLEARASRRLGCGGKAADPACDVTVRYLGFAWRGVAPRRAFRSLLCAFALADADPRFVGVNIVMPEDDPVALRGYDLHMAMFRFLAARYPQVHISMHAGELALGLVPPDDLRDHITEAVAAGAQRIGHGTDIAYEDDANATLARMARDHVAVEINLTSNAVILGVFGGMHPLKLYQPRRSGGAVDRRRRCASLRPHQRVPARRDRARHGLCRPEGSGARQPAVCLHCRSRQGSTTGRVEDRFRTL